MGSNDDEGVLEYAAARNEGDLEQQAASAYSTAVASSIDPYSLKAGLKTDDDLKNLKKSKKKKAEAYYEKQNVLIGDLLRPLEEHVENAKASERANRLPVSINLGSFDVSLTLRLVI